MSERDTWTAGSHYEPYVGRWSRRVAKRFLTWLRPGAGLDWLDVGCGTGAVTETILSDRDPRSVIGFDASPGFVEYARAHVVDRRARFEVADAQDLPLPDADRDVAVSGLVLNFVPDPERATAEMARVVRPGGTVAAYVWDYAEGMEMMRFLWDAAVSLDPAALELDEGRRFPICSPDALGDLYRRADLEALDVVPLEIATEFTDFDDYWDPFLGGQGPAPSYVDSLSDSGRAELRDLLRWSLPSADDGSIRLTARAWAVRGVVPG